MSIERVLIILILVLLVFFIASQVF